MAAIELPVDYEQLMMQPGVDVPDAHGLLRGLLHRPSWQEDAACRARGLLSFTRPLPAVASISV